MRSSKHTGLENLTNHVFACRDADAQGASGPWPGWVRPIMIQCRGAFLCQEIEKMVEP